VFFLPNEMPDRVAAIIVDALATVTEGGHGA
jgi:hypothetical protein